MTKEKIQEVLNIYKKRLLNLSKKEFPQKESLPNFPKVVILQHVSTMVDKIEEFLKEDRIEKAFRWLGFIQGCMWVNNLYTIEELKNHNRP